MSRIWVLVAGVVTFTVTTIGCVVLFFKPLSEGDTIGAPWPAVIAVPIYMIASVVLHNWLSRAVSSSCKAAFALGAAQAILIVDLLARAERGPVTSVAGIAMLIVTWGSLGFVHAWVTKAKSAS